MKKFTCFIAALALTSIVFTSCHKNEYDKEYTCQCIDKTTGVGTESFSIHAESDGEAETTCENDAKAGETCYKSY